MARPFPRVLWYFTIWFMKMQQLFEKKFVKKAEIFPTCFVEKFRHKMLCFFVKNRLVLRGFRFAFCRYCGHEQPAARAVPTGCAQSTDCFLLRRRSTATRKTSVKAVSGLTKKKIDVADCSNSVCPATVPAKIFLQLLPGQESKRLMSLTARIRCVRRQYPQKYSCSCFRVKEVKD